MPGGAKCYEENKAGETDREWWSATLYRVIREALSDYWEVSPSKNFVSVPFQSQE